MKQKEVRIEELPSPELSTLRIRKVKSSGDFIVEEVEFECKAKTVNEALKGVNELLKVSKKICDNKP